MTFPADLKYTKDHEWTRVSAAASSHITVGITAFAVEQLGDITLVSLDIHVGDELEVGKAFGTIESVKTLSDLYAPVSGKVIAINQALEGKPELVNEDPYGQGWMVELEVSAAGSLDALLDAQAYEAHVKAAAG